MKQGDRVYRPATGQFGTVVYRDDEGWNCVQWEPRPDSWHTDADLELVIEE